MQDKVLASPSPGRSQEVSIQPFNLSGCQGGHRAHSCCINSSPGPKILGLEMILCPAYSRQSEVIKILLLKKCLSNLLYEREKKYIAVKKTYSIAAVRERLP
jgi:hypothetical protein